MNQAAFFKNFNLLADQPDAVVKLRGLVLQLAIRGELVQQNRADGSASSNFSSPPSQIPESDVPFKLPTAWLWVELRSLAQIIRGVSYRKHEAAGAPQSNYVPLLRANNIGEGLNFDDLVYVPKANVSDEQFVKKHDVLIAMSSGSKNLVGKAAQAKVDFHGGFGAFCGLIRLSEKIHPQYFGLFMRTPFYRARIAAAGQGIGINNLQKGSLEALPVPVPPLTEQRRIVAKVDELMALCDELEQRQQARQHAHGQLQQSALHHLLAARDPQRFAAAWQRVRDHFQVLYDTPNAIPQLRQAILQLAVQGRLVPQIPREGNGRSIVEQIMRQRGFKAPANTTVDLPSLPKSWAAISVQDIFEVAGGIQKTPMRAPRENAFPYLRVANVQRGKLLLDDVQKFELHDGELERWRLEPNDLLVVEGNGSEDEIGRCAQWHSEISDCVHQNHIIRCRPIGHDARFAILFFNSPAGINEMKRRAITTSGLYSLSIGKIRSLPIPLPPLAEQKRIVARVEELLRWCDTLEAQLQQSRTLGTQVLDATLYRLLAG